jgi:hypothetical protein
MSLLPYYQVLESPCWFCHARQIPLRLKHFKKMCYYRQFQRDTLLILQLLNSCNSCNSFFRNSYEYFSGCLSKVRLQLAQQK